MKYHLYKTLEHSTVPNSLSKEELTTHFHELFHVFKFLIYQFTIKNYKILPEPRSLNFYASTQVLPYIKEISYMRKSLEAL